MNGQSKLHSWLETVANLIVGIFISTASQFLVLPLIGVAEPAGVNFAMTAWFTLLSVGRSFAMRRIFNRWHTKTVVVPLSD